MLVYKRIVDARNESKDVDIREFGKIEQPKQESLLNMDSFSWQQRRHRKTSQDMTWDTEMMLDDRQRRINLCTLKHGSTTKWFSAAN